MRSRPSGPLMGRFAPLAAREGPNHLFHLMPGVSTINSTPTLASRQMAIPLCGVTLERAISFQR